MTVTSGGTRTIKQQEREAMEFAHTVLTRLYAYSTLTDGARSDVGLAATKLYNVMNGIPENGEQ